MAIKMGSDGTLYCNTVKRKWKQCLNMVSINDYRWTGQGATYGTGVGGIAISDGGYIIAQVPVILASLNRTYYFAIKTSTSTSGAYVSAIIYNLAVGENPIGAMSLSSSSQTLKGWASMRGYGIASHISDNSNARIKIYSHGGTVTIEKIILVDLTDGFGLGDEPSLTWCDNNIKERFTLPVRGTSDRFDLNSDPYFAGSGFSSFTAVPRDIGSVTTGAVFRE